MAKRTVKKIVFHAIARQLRQTRRSQADIAADYNVSTSTVSSINNAGTWGNYLSNTKAAKPLRAPVRPEAPTKVEKAKRAGLNPQTRDDRFQAELDKIASKYATKTELSAQVNRLDERATTISLNSKNRSADAIKLAASTRRRATIALLVSAVALVLSVIALSR